MPGLKEIFGQDGPALLAIPINFRENQRSTEQFGGIVMLIYNYFVTIVELPVSRPGARLQVIAEATYLANIDQLDAFDIL